jgi:hypothetical protein
MKLRDLKIERQLYGKDEGQYISRVTVDDDDAMISLKLPPEITNTILKVCIGQLTSAVDSAANELRERLIASVNHVPLMLEAGKARQAITKA